MFRLIAVVAVFALCQQASAQAVYKCSVDGRVSYGDRPCATGNTVELPVPAAPPAAPAREQARRDRETLLQLEKVRLAGELRDEREQARARRTGAAQRQKCERLRLQRKWAEEDLARSSGQRAEAARVKARRHAEALAVECPG